METKETIQIKVYRDNKIDRLQTYKPVVREKLTNFALKVDYFFVNNEWPRQLADDGSVPLR